jgi:hypothetical protein
LNQPDCETDSDFDPDADPGHLCAPIRAPAASARFSVVRLIFGIPCYILWRS